MTFARAVILGGVPAGIMLLSTMIGLGREVPTGIAGALQHFAAGVLLCTVASELLPSIMAARGLAENIAAFVGFFMGVAVLILLGLFSRNVLGDDQKDDDRKRTEIDSAEAVPSSDDEKSDAGVGFFFFLGCQHSPSPGQTQQLREGRFCIAGRRYRQIHTTKTVPRRLAMKRSMSLSSLPLVSAESSFKGSYRSMEPTSPLGENSKSEPPNKISKNNNCKKMDKIKEEDDVKQQNATKLFPLAFVLAVAIDSSLDGLLIGIASAAGKSAGPMMSASLSVEMGFLGLTLATTLFGQTMPKAVLSGLVGPVCRKFFRDDGFYSLYY